MKDFEFYAPTHFVFGKGVVDRVGEGVVASGCKSVLLAYGKGSVVRSGLLDRVKASLAQQGVTVFELAGVRPNPEVQQVREGIAMVRENGIDGLVAVGGGSVIDCAKAIAFGSTYDGDVWDFFCGKAKVTAALPITAVLTIPAAGSEASSSCVISNDELGAKNGTNGDAFRPKFAYMDPEVTFTLPPYQTAAGVTDMVSHVCERLFSGVGDVSVTDNIAFGLILTLMEMAPRALENPEDYDARANIMWVSTLAHNDIAGCGRSLVPTGRAGGWESHALEHALSAFNTSITHGAGLAVVMPAWMRYVWREDPSRFLLFAREVFGIEPLEPEDEGFESEEVAVEDAIEVAIDELQAFFAEMGMPTRLADFGITDADLDDIVARVIAAKGEVFGAFKKLNAEDVRAIYESAL